MIRAISCCAVGLIVCSAAVQGLGNWKTLRRGVEVLEGSISDGGLAVTFILVRCDPKQTKVRVIDTFHDIGASNPFAAFSVREVAAKTGALITVNGGSTRSFTLPSPSGLLMAHGQVIHDATLFPKTAGVLCIAGDRVMITGPSSFGQFHCSDAVQRGPLLSAESPNVADVKNEQYRRTVVAVDEDGRFLILVTNGKASLAAISTYVYSTPSLRVRFALNMDGDRSSGLLADKSWREGHGNWNC